jgi:hypothetical protein
MIADLLRSALGLVLKHNANVLAAGGSPDAPHAARADIQRSPRGTLAVLHSSAGCVLRLAVAAHARAEFPGDQRGSAGGV